MRIVKLIFTILLGVTLIALCLSNRAPVTFSFFPLPFEITLPLFLLVIIAIIFGALIGEIIGLMHSYRLKKLLKEEKQRVKALESELLLKTMAPPATQAPLLETEKP